MNSRELRNERTELEASNLTNMDIVIRLMEFMEIDACSGSIEDFWFMTQGSWTRQAAKPSA